MKSFRYDISWVVAGNVLRSFLGFFVSILVARILTKADYGSIDYVASWVSFFNAFAILGINDVINKFLDKDDNKSHEYLCSALLLRFISSVIFSLLFIAVMLVMDKDNPNIKLISIVYASYFISEIGQLLIYWFRAKRESKIITVYRLISFAISSIFKIIAVVVLKNIYIYTFGIVLETLLFSILLLYKYHKSYSLKFVVSKESIKKILKVSSPFIVASVLANLYIQTDKVMIKNLLNVSEVASYSIALTLTGITSVFATAVIEGFRAEIMNSYREDKKMYRRRLRQLYCILFYICVGYGLFITIFSKQVILLLYGEKYLSSATALSIMVWYTTFTYFGTANQIYFVAEEKEKWVPIIALIGTVLNIFMDYLLIPTFGINGAAFATLITQFGSNFLLLLLVKDFRPLISDIIGGILVRDVISFKKEKN